MHTLPPVICPLAGYLGDSHHSHNLIATFISLNRSYFIAVFGMQPQHARSAS